MVNYSPSIHSFIHFLLIDQFRYVGGLEHIPVVIYWEVGYTLDRLFLQGEHREPDSRIQVVSLE